MAIPQWLAITIAILVLVYGGYRMWLAVGGPSDEVRAQSRNGMLRMSRRSNGLVGVLLLVAGALLMGSAFGWSPWGSPSPTEPAPGAGTDAPARTALPVR